MNNFWPPQGSGGAPVQGTATPADVLSGATFESTPAAPRAEAPLGTA